MADRLLAYCRQLGRAPVRGNLDFASCSSSSNSEWYHVHLFSQVTYLCQTNDLQRPFTLACPTTENLFARLNVFTDILWLFAHVGYSVHVRCFEYLSIA